MNYQETLDYLFGMTPAFEKVGGEAYKPGLGNIEKLLDALEIREKGSSYLGFRCVHVGGTNGKGSVSHLLAAVLQESGYKTGLYTSPHLVDYRDRMRINGQMISENWVVDFVEKHKSLIEDIRPSFFELTTAMCFSWFKEQGVDVGVIEVGLGGRLDSTNVILPDLSVITNIGMDHEEYLGDTLEKIANEKAGIIKQNTPVVVGEWDIETYRVFESRAEEMGSRLRYASKENFADLDCELRGIYQVKNKQTARCVIDELRRLGYQISEQSERNGFLHVCSLTGLRGRWDEVNVRGRRVIMDTGHNSHGIRTYISELEKIDGLRVVFGMVKDKDVDVVVGMLPSGARYYWCSAQTKRAVSSEDMLLLGDREGLKGKSYSSVKEAVETALEESDEGDTIFIGGSNYVVGEAMEKVKELQKKYFP